MVSAPDKKTGPYWFNAVLHPHRSLSGHGFFVLMVVCCLVAFVLGLRFYFLGAWPVFAFLGLDILALYIAFRVNYRRARMYETVQLTDDDLKVRRVMPDGKAREWRFMPGGVRIKLAQPATWRTPVTLSAPGESVQIATFLTPEERTEFAGALRAALKRQQAALADSEDTL